MSKERLFRFKRFAVSHSQSAIPVGMDGVLIGAWCSVSQALRVLDAGTGCGLIALMCAQRSAEARITAIDIHSPSVEEAVYNFTTSPWARRLEARLIPFAEFAEKGFDLIVSNPPFFHAGVSPTLSDARLRARHSGAFGPEALLTQGAKMLSESGRISLIAPAPDENPLCRTAEEAGLYMRRICRVSSVTAHPPVRVLLEASRQPGPCEITHLTIHTPDGDFTQAYRTLTHDFYLKF